MKNFKWVAIATLIVLIISVCVYFSANNNNRTGCFKLSVIVFEDADAGISKVSEVQLANVYYVGDLMLEEVPKIKGAEYCFFNETKFSGYFNSLDQLNFDKKLSIKEKKNGAVALADTIPNYSARVNMTDTVMGEIAYKRFAVNNEEEYSVFYVTEKKDIPYSLNRIAEKDYKGTITRIDTYQRKEDLFISLRLINNDTIPRKFYNKLKIN